MISSTKTNPIAKNGLTRRSLLGLFGAGAVGIGLSGCNFTSSGASIPLVTGFAALRSGVAVLMDNNAEGSLVGRFVIALRQNLHRNLLLGTLVIAAAGIGSTDVAMAMTGKLGLATVPVEATGLILLLAVAVLPFWAAALPHPPPDTSLRKLMRHTILVAAARPAHSAVLLTAVLAGTAAAAMAPILVPIAVGVLARISAQLPAKELKLSANT